MASKRRNMFHKNKTQETTEEGLALIGRRRMRHLKPNLGGDPFSDRSVIVALCTIEMRRCGCFTFRALTEFSSRALKGLPPKSLHLFTGHPLLFSSVEVYDGVLVQEFPGRVLNCTPTRPGDERIAYLFQARPTSHFVKNFSKGLT
ncbi:hypothetical protein AAG570_011961 [Ranatra chinensis]|uniref:Uncharacterized protein n=1 Tax=Ranatra chinensis TaxID=642074 RepID=A0ABD0YHM4_9HEMI